MRGGASGIERPVGTGSPSGARPRPSRFFVWMAGLCVVFAVAGFTPTYLGPLVAGDLEPFRAVVHIHGALFFGWTLLLLLQTTLVARGRTSAHRSLGLVGIALATAMVIFGGIVSLAANEARMDAGQVDRAYALGFSNTAALLGFATLFALAVIWRRRPESHKRLMLFATCMILTPALGRLYRPVFAPAQPPPLLVFATLDAIVVATLIHDWRRLGRPHPTTVACGALILSVQVLRFPLPGMAWWHATYDVLLGLLR